MIRPIPAQRATSLAVVTVDPVMDVRWQGLLGLPAAGLFHSPPWMLALADAYSFKASAHLAVDPAGHVDGGVAFCTVADLFKQRAISLPFSDTCDPLLTSGAAWPALFDQLTKSETPIFLRCLKDEVAPADPRLQVVKRARWHTLPLESGADASWKGFGAAARRAIRKAQAGGVIVRPLDGSDGLQAFHRLHVALRKRKYRLLAQPLAFFEAIRRRFEAADGWFPLGAFVDGELVAATIYLRWGDTLYYKFNASSPVALEMRPNNLLVWSGIELAQSLGCRTLDFGPSDDDQPGLIRFKRQFGASERELRFLRHVPPEWQDHRGDEMRRLLGELTQLLTSPNISDELTAQGGAALYRFFA